MKKLQWLLIVSAIALLAAFAVWVWPTPWRYDELVGNPVRTNRFTGSVEHLTMEGWKTKDWLADERLPAVQSLKSDYLRAIADSSKKTCRANLQTIANAVQAARVKGRLSNYVSFIGPVDLTKEPDLPAVPICPEGGTYTIVPGTEAGNFAVHCSILAHVTPEGDFEPGKSYR